MSFHFTSCFIVVFLFTASLSTSNLNKSSAFLPLMYGTRKICTALSLGVLITFENIISVIRKIPPTTFVVLSEDIIPAPLLIIILSAFANVTSKSILIGIAEFPSFDAYK